MRRALTVLATSAVLGSLAVSAPASAAAAKGPGLGTWTCSDAAAATTAVAALELVKGNKYAVDGGDKAKYVYKAGQDKVKFKSGAYEGVYYGLFDKETKILALHAVADDDVWASCVRDEPAPEPAPVP